MCKHKLRKQVKNLKAEVAELKAKMDEHVGHYIYPYPFTTSTSTYPYPLTSPISTTYTFPTTTYDGNGGASSEG